MPTRKIVKGPLPPHQAESGLVSESELDLVRRWVAAVESAGAGTTMGRAWLDEWLGTALPFSFRYGGKASNSVLGERELWKEESEGEGDSERRTFIWRDAATGLQVTWEVKQFADYPAVEWVIWFENKGGHDTAIVEDVQALDLWLNRQERGKAYIVHGANGGRSKLDDLMPFSRQVPFLGSPPHTEIELGGDFLSSNVHLPFFNVETPEDRGVLVGIGWSGTWLARVRAHGNQLQVHAGLKETYFVLHPGERVRTPRVLLLFWEGRRLHGHNMLRQLLHRHYIPCLRGQQQAPLVAANAAFSHHGKGLYFLHEATEEGMLSAARSAIEVGAELFIIDAGWYEGAPWYEMMGKWQISRGKYPQGFRPISEVLTAADVQLGVWFAPEVVMPAVAPPDGHPEWVEPGGPRERGRLRMELPEAREWFLGQVQRIIEDEGMTCYRQDISPERCIDPPGARVGITEMLHIEGLYTMWDTLVQRHPGLVMEGCCGGGRRIDLETVSRFHWIQKSDRWFDSESDQCSLYGANLYLPGGYLILYTEAVDDYGAWSSFGGVLSEAWHTLDADFPMEVARRQVERYKRIRHLLSGDFYPLTPCSLDADWLAYQFHRTDLSEGMALVFRRFNSKRAVYPVSNTFVLQLRGLEPQKRYRVRFEKAGTERTLTGEALATGIEMAIEEAPGAEMVLYEAAA